MADNRFIINEVRRNLKGVTVESLSALIDCSPTLQTLVEQNYQGLLTPTDVTKILQEIEDCQKVIVDKSTLGQLLANIKNNPFFVTPDESEMAKKYSSFEDIPLYSNSLLTSNDEIFIDPSTGAAVLSPTPNARISSPARSREGYVGDLDPRDVENIQLLIEDEIRTEYLAQGYNHAVDTITDDGKIGLYGLTVKDLIAIGVIAQNAVDLWQQLRGDEDWAKRCAVEGIISDERYQKIPVQLRSALHWYVLANRSLWVETFLGKILSPKDLTRLRELQKFLSYRFLLKDWKTNFRFFALAKITEKSQIAGYLILQRIFGKNARRISAVGGLLGSIIGRQATEVFDRATRGILAGQQSPEPAADINALDEAAASIPASEVPALDAPKQDLSGDRPRNFSEFSNVEAQPTNTALRQIPPNQGFHDPNNIYPRVTRIGEPDTNRLARGEKISDTVVGAKDDDRILDVPVARGAAGEWSQPKSPYNAKYPYNHVTETESGHVIEYDDTPDNERMHWYHREGTFMEIDRNGTMVRKIVGDGYEIYERDGYIYIGGRANITVEGNCNIYVKNNVNLQVDGNLNADVHKNMSFNVAKNFDVTAGGSINLKAQEFLNVQSMKENVNIKAKKKASTTADDVNLRANDKLNLYGDSEINVTAGLPTKKIKIVGTINSFPTSQGTASFPIVLPISIVRAPVAGGATSGDPVRERNPQEPELPPLILESRTDMWSEALSTLAENSEENQNEISVLKKRGVDEGLVTTEDLERPLTSGETDSSRAPTLKPARIASCNIIYGTTSFPLTYRLTENVTLGMLKGNNLRDQHGLRKQDIVCNLRQLAENVIEPVFDLLGKGKILITSCIRYPGYNTGSLRPAQGVSFHEQGLAVDMCFLNTPFSQYYDYALNLKRNIQYDKLLLEYRIGTVKGVTTYKPWIHIQWQQSGINMANGRSGGNARLEAFTMKNDVRVTPVGTLTNFLPGSTLQY
jgi:hypothetical protein